MKLQMEHIDDGHSFDWAQSAEDYARFRDIYPDSFYKILTDANLGIKGQACLDLGTGTGVLPRRLYPYGAAWTGADITEAQIEQAKALAQQEQKGICFLTAPAENTGLPDAAFDLVTACQCWPYFDVKKTVPEICRLLKSHRHLVILYMAWLPFESETAMQSEDLVRKYNPQWNGGYFKREPVTEPEWAQKNFTCRRCIGYAEDVPFTRNSWHGRMLACRGTGASSIPPADKAAFAAEHRAMLEKQPPEFTIPHWITAIDLEKNI